MRSQALLKGIVFDLDGTLADSLSVTFDAFNAGFERFGRKRLSPAEIMSYFGPGEGEIFAEIVGQENADEAFLTFRAHLDARLADVPLHPGVEDLLKQLQDARVPVSIVTGRSWNTTEMILNHHGLLDRFVTVIANDHVDFPKPAPQGIELALKRMELKPSEIIYVGDSHYDVVAAKRAGSGSVAALWDLLADRMTLEAHDPHHFAETPADVWRIYLAGT